MENRTCATCKRVFSRKSDLTYHRRFAEGDCSAAHAALQPPRSERARRRASGGGGNNRGGDGGGCDGEEEDCGGGDSGSGSGGADLPSPAKVARLPPPAPPVPEAATSGDDDTLPAAKVARIVQTAPPPFPVLGQPACTKCSRNDDQHLCSCAFRSGAGRRITAAVCRHHWMQRPWWVDLWGPAACRVCGHS